jgi:oligoendopeptidase F
LISLNLYQNYKNSSDKNDFLKKYHEFLASGGSDTPENLLKDIFDMKFDENFYNTAFSNINELIDKLD